MLAAGMCNNTTANISDVLLVIHYFLTKEHCGPDFKIFNYVDSLLYAIDYLNAQFDPSIPYAPSFTFLKGCSLRK
ncbi:unnamed protein product [Dibothriocephalus latus]|uniref:Uncharacterized protein n=1 Tax=Dibothriocephalus latus TaxID=60516 RepID=A0A3P7PX84_DIBLA|nr:unnamed protein product [Dibothriocephalus latus]